MQVVFQENKAVCKTESLHNNLIRHVMYSWTELTQNYLLEQGQQLDDSSTIASL